MCAHRRSLVPGDQCMRTVHRPANSADGHVGDGRMACLLQWSTWKNLCASATLFAGTVVLNFPYLLLNAWSPLIRTWKNFCVTLPITKIGCNAVRPLICLVVGSFTLSVRWVVSSFAFPFRTGMCSVFVFALLLRYQWNKTWHVHLCMCALGCMLLWWEWIRGCSVAPK